MFTLTCIKPACGNTYESHEDEAYYCPTCKDAQTVIAKKLSKRFNTVGQVPSSALAQYDMARQGRQFPRASDLGVAM